MLFATLFSTQAKNCFAPKKFFPHQQPCCWLFLCTFKTCPFLEEKKIHWWPCFSSPFFFFFFLILSDLLAHRRPCCVREKRQLFWVFPLWQGLGNNEKQEHTEGNFFGWTKNLKDHGPVFKEGCCASQWLPTHLWGRVAWVGGAEDQYFLRQCFEFSLKNAFWSKFFLKYDNIPSEV